MAFRDTCFFVYCLTPETYSDLLGLNFMYSEKAPKFCKISFVPWFVLCSDGQIFGRDFAKFCGLLRIYGLQSPKRYLYSIWGSKATVFESANLKSNLVNTTPFLGSSCCKRKKAKTLIRLLEAWKINGYFPVWA